MCGFLKCIVFLLCFLSTCFPAIHNENIKSQMQMRVKGLDNVSILNNKINVIFKFTTRNDES